MNTLRAGWPKIRAVISVGVEICLFTTVSRPTKFSIKQIPYALSQGIEPPLPSNKWYDRRIGGIAPFFLKLRHKMSLIKKQMYLIRVFILFLLKVLVHYSIHNSRTTTSTPKQINEFVPSRVLWSSLHVIISSTSWHICIDKKPLKGLTWGRCHCRVM